MEKKKYIYHSPFWDGKRSIAFLKNNIFLNPRCYGILKSEWEIPHSHYSCEITGRKSKDEIVETSEELTCRNNAIVQLPRQGLGLWWGIAAQLPGRMVLYWLPIPWAPNLEGKQENPIFPQEPVVTPLSFKKKSWVITLKRHRSLGFQVGKRWWFPCNPNRQHLCAWKKQGNAETDSQMKKTSTVT